MVWLQEQFINSVMKNRNDIAVTSSVIGNFLEKDYLLYIIGIAYLISQVGLFLMKGSFINFPVEAFAALDVFILTLAASVHGIGRYGLKNMFVFFMVTSVVSWCMESASIAYGLPFGNYYYSEILVPKLGNVPLVILPAYFSMGYISWTLGLILTRQFHRKITGSAVFTIPLVSAFLMTANDLCFDPVASTILKNWIWKDGGAYFGVPYINFLGWYLTVYLIFQIFAFYVSRSKTDQPVRIDMQITWIFPIVIFFLTGLNYLFTPLVIKENPEIHQSLSLVTLFTMIFSSVLCYINVHMEFKEEIKPDI